MGQHKHAGTGLLARTRSSTSDILRMAEACASQQQPDFFRGIGPISTTGRSDRGLEFAVMSGLGNKFKQLTFTLMVESVSDQRTARTRITWYRTSQPTVAGFIPAGPKTMLGFKSYELFLTRLTGTLREADASADIRVSATAATDSVGSRA